MPTKEIDSKKPKIYSAPQAIKQIDYQKELEKLLDSKKDLLELEEKINKKQFEVSKAENSLNNKKEETWIILDKIVVLRDTMKLTFGSSSLFGEGSGNPLRVFTDDDLIKYKQKMLELIKQL